MKGKYLKYLPLFLIFVLLLNASPVLGITNPNRITGAKATITLSKTKLTLNKNKSSTLIATVTGSSKAVTWESSDPSVASVSKGGIVKAIKPGYATITATANGVSAKCKVTVKGLEEEKITLRVGEKDKLILYGTKIKSTKSDDKAVATVTKDGTIKALKKGKAKIIFTGTDKKQYKCIVTVLKKESVKISQDHLYMVEGSEAQLTLKGTELKKVSSDDESVAIVSREGVVTAIGAGKAKILLTGRNGKSYKCIVEVQPVLREISLSNTKLTLVEGNTYQLKATPIPSNATDKNLRWRSSNEKIIKIDNGKITALKEGVATVRVDNQTGNVYASCNVIVKSSSSRNGYIKYDDCVENTYAFTLIPDNYIDILKNIRSEHSEIATDNDMFALAYIDDNNIPDLCWKPGNNFCMGILALNGVKTSLDSWSGSKEYDYIKYIEEDYYYPCTGVFESYTSNSNFTQIVFGSVVDNKSIYNSIAEYLCKNLTSPPSIDYYVSGDGRNSVSETVFNQALRRRVGNIPKVRIEWHNNTQACRELEINDSFIQYY